MKHCWARIHLTVISACLSLLTLAQGAPEPAALQVQACRAVGSLLLARGEGFQPADRARFDGDLAALDAALGGLPAAERERLQPPRQRLVELLRRGLSAGPREEDLPWDYLQELSAALRDFLAAARSLPGAAPEDELPAKVEYLAVQYLGRAYLGGFEIAREQSEIYLGQDERVLLPAIDAQLKRLDGTEDPALGKLKSRWSFLKAAFGDMNSQGNLLVSASGRPYAPMVVARHARALSEQWLALP